MASIGRINEFILNKDDWTTYSERLEQYFIANDVVDEKRKAILLTVIGNDAYELLRDLCTPTAPSAKTFAQLCDILKNHLCPKPSIIAERYKMRQRRQEEGEAMAQYVAALKKLASTCEFGANLDENLRDQLVWGCRNDVIRQRLFAEEQLTYKRAVELATSLEAAERNATITVGTTSAMHKLSSDNTPGTRHPSVKCFCCGRVNHKANECKYKNFKCRICGAKGHLAKMCTDRSNASKVGKSNAVVNKSRQNHYVQLDSEDDECPVFNINSSDSLEPYLVKVQIDGHVLNMELDTGAAISVIAEKLYLYKFKHCPLQKTNVCLKSYTGDKIYPVGYIEVLVKYKNKSEFLDLYVIKNGGPPLMGRPWLNSLGIMDKNINAIRPVYSDKDLANKFKSLFSSNTGLFTKGEATLSLTENARPIFLRHRVLPLALREKVEKQLDHLLNSGIISKVETSDWGTPIVPVIKKDGSVRICGDFKVTLNPSLKIDKYPLPRIEELFAELSGGVQFSKIDLTAAYQQMPLSESSKKYTTISTHKGLYYYHRLPYGVASAPGYFQRTMEQILQGLPRVVVFLDDILVTGRTELEHWNNLNEVCKRLENCGLTIRLNKCDFFKNEISYLGFKINAEGLQTDKSKVDAIRKARVPENVTELKSFLGLVNYYIKFIKNASTVLSPLYNLLHKKVKWNWNEQCNRAFKQIKELMLSSKILVHYDPRLPLKLACDASQYGVGAVISHVFPNGDEKPVAFASRTLSDTEKKYSQIDKEALAIIFGVKKFHQYLYGRQFILLTDHKPLISIFGSKVGIPQMTAYRMQRWALILAGYQYTIQYVKSENNCVADGLSRLPLNNEFMDKTNNEFGYINFVQATVPIDFKCIAIETRRDKILSKILYFINHGWPNSNWEKELAPYVQRKNEIYCEQGCIMWGYRVIVPSKLQNNVLKEIHDSHMGIVKCKSLARSYVWWPNLDKQIEEVCNSCRICAQLRSAPPKNIVHPWIWPDKPWQRLHADFLGPFKGQMYLIVLDAKSKWIEVFKMQKTNAYHTISKIRSIFARFGLPWQFVTDNGPPFSSLEFKAFMKNNGIKHSFSPPYHPASNGAAENAVRTVKKSLKSALLNCINNHIPVEVALDQFLMTYRNTPHSLTGSSPAQELLSRSIRTRLDILRPDINNYVKQKQLSQIEYRGGQSKEVGIGDTVMARDFKDPMHPTWSEGKIINKSGPVTYVVETDAGNWKRHKNQIVPVPSELKGQRTSTGLRLSAALPIRDNSSEVAQECDGVIQNENNNVSTNTDDRRVSISESIPGTSVQPPITDMPNVSRRYPKRNIKPRDRFTFSQ